MFPLGSVLFPRALLPLHVFEPRYRMLVHDCMRGDREFGVVLIERGGEVGGGDVRFETGTVARIVQSNPLPGGRLALATVGTERFRVERWLPEDPYPCAEVESLPEPAPAPGARERRAAVLAGLERVVALLRRLDPRVGDVTVVLDDDPRVAAYEAAALAPLGALDAQRVLEAAGPDERLDLLATLLAEQAAILEARLGGGTAP